MELFLSKISLFSAQGNKSQNSAVICAGLPASADPLSVWGSRLCGPAWFLLPLEGPPPVLGPELEGAAPTLSPPVNYLTTLCCKRFTSPELANKGVVTRQALHTRVHVHIPSINSLQTLQSLVCPSRLCLA